jgi:hypothetical protein
LAICVLSVILSFLPKATSSPMVVYLAIHTMVAVLAICSMEVVLAIHATVAVLAIYRTEEVSAIDAMEEASDLVVYPSVELMEFRLEILLEIRLVILKVEPLDPQLDQL